MKIGFIGLGQMGSAIASNLLKAGHDLTVWNRSSEKAEALVAAGAKRAVDPADAANGEIVFSMLADDRAAKAVVCGDGGIAGCPALHVSMSTISVDLAERFATDLGSGGGYVSAPVFGRPAMAAAAKLFIVAAGKSADLERCESAFQAIGHRVFRVGENPSSANLVKLTGNFMILSAIEAMAEAMTLAEKGGVSRTTLLEVLTGTNFDAPVYRTYGEILVEDRFKPAGFTAQLGLKDMTLVDSAAARLQAAMPSLAVLRGNLRSAIAQEGPDIDWTGVALAIRKDSELI